jgi:hypothetical protein
VSLRPRAAHRQVRARQGEADADEKELNATCNAAENSSGIGLYSAQAKLGQN